jgi:diguanylate cyclase (GGDEF)-like protein/PAS domain S-box-containing protein
MSGIMPTLEALLTGDRFYALLALAVVVGWFASLGAVSLFRLALTSPSASATAWLLIGGPATGIGVWATDLIVVEAYIQDLPIRYHPVLVAFALVAATAVMTAGLWVAAKRSAFWCAPVGGAILGAGVTAMHYLGVWSLELPGHVTLSIGWVAASVALSLFFAIAALTIAVLRADRRGLFAATTLLALGVVTHQFVGIAAVAIVSEPTRTIAAFSVSHLSLAFGTAGAAITMLLFCFAGAFADRSHQEMIGEQNLLHNDALGIMAQGLCMFDADGRLVFWNDRFAEMYAIQGKLRVGFTLREILQQRIEAGTLGEDPDEFARRANGAALEGVPFRHIFELPDGRKVSVANQARPTGGWVSTHEDITELKQRAASFRLLFESNPVPMWVYEQSTLRFLAVNDAAVGHYGYSRQQFLAMTILEIRPAEDRESVRQAAEEKDYHADRTWRHIKADGTQIEVAIFARALPYEGRPAGICAIVDLTDRNRAEEEVRRTRTFLDTIIDNVPTNIIVKELPSFRYLLVNKAGEKHFGLPREQMIGKTAAEFFPKETADLIQARDLELLESGQEQFSDEHTIVTPSDGTHIVTTTRFPVRGSDGNPQYMISVVHDVTQRKRFEARIAHMAHHDSLTDLPNRTAFNECLAATLEKTASAKKSFALLCVDLDRFKEINDVFGHAIGDEMLRQVSARLVLACEGAFLARLGGDEFSVISAAGPQPSGAEAISERLYAAMADDIEIQGHPLRAGLTIGVSIYPDDGTDAASLIANADAALYRAKAEARGSIRFFEPDMDKRLREKRALQHDLRSAVARNELELHYQPQALIGGEITGFEALARWRHPSRGLVPPDVFIPLAEESGLIMALGEWALREACREAASWPKPLNIAINLSPVQFQHGDLAALVHAVLLETGLKPSRLELEITEGVLISDFSRAVSILRRLKALGVRIAMDDFGTGYSSLSYLQAFPFDKIKIDQAFISSLDRSPQSEAIVRAVIGLGRGLGLPITAEGVETQAQLDFLTRESCQEIQGYLIGRPGPIANYAELVGQTVAEQIKALAS